MRAGCIWTFLLMALSLLSPARAQDVLFTNGRIVTLDGASRVAEAMLVSGDTIRAVGATSDLRTLAGAKREIDLAGRTLIPGLIDSHIHAIRGGLTYSVQVNWIGATSLADALARLRARAGEAGPGAWLVVPGGWNAQQFAERRRPTQAEIAEAGQGHPVYVQLSYTSILLSRSGYEALGIHGEADLPENARIERDPSGEPTGWINGTLDAIVDLYARLPRATLEQSMAGTRAFFRELNAFGITGISDPGGHNLDRDQYAALFSLWRERGLSLRVRFSYCARRSGSELDDFQAVARTMPMNWGDDMLRFNGIGECVTWGMYNNDHPTNAQKQEFEDVAVWAARTGMRLTIHWNNDASVSELLDVFERVARVAPFAHLRWSIAHIHDATPDTLDRMKALGLGWLIQDRLYFAAPVFLANYTSRLASLPPLVRALHMDLPVGAGTDADRVMSYNPFVALQWMLDGRTISGTATRGPQETPSRDEALRTYTQGSAWFSGEEARRGRLVPGALADLAVLDDDIMSVSVEKIGGLTSLLTMVGGRIVYARGPFAGLEEPASVSEP